MKKDLVQRQNHDKEGSRREPAAPSTQVDRQTDSGVERFAELQRKHGNRYVQDMLRFTVGLGGKEAPFTARNGVGAAHQRTIPVRVDLQPHREPDHVLRSLAPIYAAGKTPIVDKQGQVTALDMAPASAATTGRHLQTIQHHFGEQGLKQTIHGLNLTRGESFAAAAMHHVGLDQHYTRAANIDTESDDNLAAGPTRTSNARVNPNTSHRTAGLEVATVLSRVGGGHKLPRTLRSKLAKLTGDRLTDVRIHDDVAANRAASLLGARAFTLGRSIYFGAGEFAPLSKPGRRLLAHEVMHAVQQRGSSIPRLEELQISQPADPEEVEAERFADSVTNSPVNAYSRRRPSIARVARIQRTISFTHSGDAFTKNTMGVGETAAGFQIRPNTTPLFEWDTNITIHGSAGDPFAQFEVGPLQVCRSLVMNFFWGTGANQTHRRVAVTPVPIRDSVVGSNWYADGLVAAPFAADGDVRATNLNDSPQSAQQPWANPVAGRSGDFGTFNYTAAFVAYISARDNTKGFAAGAFRAIGNVYWNVGISGNFHGSHPLGTRVAATGGTVNRSGIIEGASAEFPSMHGGAVANTNFVTTDT